MKPFTLDYDSTAMRSLRSVRAAAPGNDLSTRPRNDKRDHPVLMSIRISTAQLIDARRTLHQALGPNLHVYTAVIDNKTGRACLQLELSRARVSQAMSSIMRVLPEAEFGTIRRAAHEPMPRTRAVRMRETVDH